MLKFYLRELFFKIFLGGMPQTPRVRHAKACLAILHTAASLSVLLCPTTNGELQPPLAEVELKPRCKQQRNPQR